VAGSPCRQKQQRVLFANRVRFFSLAKQIVGVSELRFELLAHFRADLVATAVDAGSDGRFDVSRQRAEVAAHFSHPFFNNAFDRAAPTRMEDSDGSLLCIDEYDWQAISRLDCDDNSLHAGDEAIAYQRFLRYLFHAVNEVGVNLAQSDERPQLFAGDSAEFRQESLSVPFNCDPSVLFGKSEI